MREGLRGTAANLSVADGIKDGHTYTWRVIPVDVFGASPEANPARTFTVDNVNPSLQEAIIGAVTDQETGNPVPNATVDIPAQSLSTHTLQAGEYYFGALPADTHRVKVTAAGYQIQEKTAVVVLGDVTTADFQLTAIRNRPPYISPTIPGLQVSTVAPTVYHLATHAHDDDGPASALTWTATNVDTSLFTVSIDAASGNLTITAVAGAQGSDTITLTLCDAAGDTATQDVTVTITQGKGPVAGFSAEPATGYAPLLVQFTDQSDPGDAAIASRAWNFGDDTSSSAQNPQHEYRNPGTYTVTLTVTTSIGSDAKQIQQCVTVKRRPLFNCYANGAMAGHSPSADAVIDLALLAVSMVVLATRGKKKDTRSRRNRS